MIRHRHVWFYVNIWVAGTRNSICIGWWFGARHWYREVNSFVSFQLYNLKAMRAHVFIFFIGLTFDDISLHIFASHLQTVTCFMDGLHDNMSWKLKCVKFGEKTDAIKSLTYDSLSLSCHVNYNFMKLAFGCERILILLKLYLDIYGLMWKSLNHMLNCSESKYILISYDFAVRGSYKLLKVFARPVSWYYWYEINFR